MENLTRDKAEVERVSGDPLHWHGGVRLRMAYYSLKAMEEIQVRESARSVFEAMFEEK